MKITGFDVVDVRFPTSLVNAGTDAVHTDPDYSAAYVILKTDGAHERPRLHLHHRPRQRGRASRRSARSSRWWSAGPRWRRSPRTWPASGARSPTRSQLRWLGPEKGVIHLAHGGDRQRRLGPAGQGGRQAGVEAARRHDAARDRRVHRLPLHHRRADAGRGARDARAPARHARRSARRSCCATATRPTRRPPAGSATRTTKVRQLCREALADGWTHFKVKVGGDPADDERRVRMVRETIGPDCTLMIDANQRWDVAEAIARVKRAGAVRSLVDRGADQPGRRARACGDREGRRADRRRDRRALPPTASSSSSCCRPRRSASARSTAAGWAASTRTSR